MCIAAFRSLRIGITSGRYHRQEALRDNRFLTTMEGKRRTPCVAVYDKGFRFKDCDWIGFDMDHALVRYKLKPSLTVCSPFFSFCCVFLFHDCSFRFANSAHLQVLSRVSYSKYQIPSGGICRRIGFGVVVRNYGNGGNEVCGIHFHVLDWGCRCIMLGARSVPRVSLLIPFEETS